VTNTQIVAIGIRLFCVWLAIYVIRDLPGLWSLNDRQYADGSATAISTVIIVLVIVVALIVALWSFPLTVARKLLPRSALDEPARVPGQIERAGFCLLGLWLLTQAIPSLFYYAVMVYHFSRPDARVDLRTENFASLLHTAIELGLGIWLLFGAKGLLGLIRWARVAGTNEPSNSVVESDARHEPPRAPHHER
jgi:hypothetical protein